MGTWGTGIFAGDFASDVRGDWREALEDGLDSVAATARLLEKYAPDGVEEDDEGPTFWIALAAAQALTGRLSPEIRDRALSVIAAGGDVAVFASESPVNGRKRALALAALAATLRGPQRPPTRVRRASPVPSPAQLGDLVVVRGSGARQRRVYFIVIGIAEAWPAGSTAPEMVAIHWTGPEPPTIAEATKAPFWWRRVETERPPDSTDIWMVQGPSRGPNAFGAFAEVVASGLDRRDYPKKGSRNTRYYLTVWRNLAREVDNGWFASIAESE